MTFPIAWEIVMLRYLNVPPKLAEAWWTALCRSKWSRPTSLRQTIQLFGRIPMNSGTFLERSCSAEVLVTAIEDLRREGRLRRDQATQLEECIFTRTGPTGAWK
jgi:hypothetical protein